MNLNVDSKGIRVSSLSPEADEYIDYRWVGQGADVPERVLLLHSWVAAEGSGMKFGQ